LVARGVGWAVAGAGVCRGVVGCGGPGTAAGRGNAAAAAIAPSRSESGGGLGLVPKLAAWRPFKMEECGLIQLGIWRALGPEE
jgi:hypothetical protein